MVYIKDIPDIETWLEELVENFEKLPIIDIKNSINRALQEVYSLDLVELINEKIEEANEDYREVNEKLEELQEEYDYIFKENQELKARIEKTERKVINNV